MQRMQMQKVRWPLPVALLLVAAVAFVAACSGGSHAQAIQKPNNVVATVAPVPLCNTSAPHKPIRVCPATGSKQGVVSMGTSVKGDKSSVGLMFKCATGLETIPVSFFDDPVYYKALAITSTSNRRASGLPLLANNPVDQKSVTITFKGALSFTPVSMIVVPLNVDLHDDKVIFEDQTVVNLSANELGQDGILLETSDFSQGFISDASLCVKPINSNF